jgi:hypothetical protein
MTRSKKFIVTAIGITAGMGAVLTLAMLHAQTPAASPQPPAAAAAPTSLPGYGSPENALQSLGWAGRKGDLELLREGVTTEIQKMLHASNGPDAISHAIRMAIQLGEAKVVERQVLTDDQVLLYVQPEGKDSPWKVRMQKIGGNWKLAELVP